MLSSSLRFLPLTVLLLQFSFTSICIAGLNDGLITYYPFEGSAYDASGNNNHGEEHGGISYSTGVKAGTAAIFDGTGVVVANDPFPIGTDANHPLSVSAWIKSSQVDGAAGIANQWTAATSEGGGDNWHFTLYNDSKGLQAEVTNPGGVSVPKSLVLDGEWHHVAFIYTGANLAVFVDGVQHASQSFSPDNRYRNGTPLSIGAFFYSESEFNGHFMGSIDEVRIYDRALGTSEIDRLYNDYKPVSTLTDNLVAYYKFEGNANDSKGSNDGLGHNGVTYVNGLLGDAASLDGVNDYIEIPDHPSLDITKEITLSAWVYNKGPNESWARIISRSTSGVGNRQYNLAMSQDGKNIRTIVDTTTQSALELIGNTLSDRWHHVSMTFNKDSSLNLYLDGELQGSRPANSSLVSKSSNVVIGGFSLNPTNGNFNGVIDEVRIYNRALSHHEISMLYDLNSEIAKSFVPPPTPSELLFKNNTSNTAASCFIDTKGSPGPVLAATGNYYTTQTDFSIPSLGPDLKITRYYNSQDLYDGPFGHGWNTDYTSQLILAEDGNGDASATVRLGNGVRRVFTVNQDGSFTAPINSDDTLMNTGTSEDPVYVFNGNCSSCDTKPRTSYTFDAAGFLSSIADPNDNQLTVGYDSSGRISDVTDANSRSLSITYGNNGRVDEITDFTNRTWSYGYDENDNLTSVTDPLQNTIAYSYDDNHNLLSITDAQGNTVAAMGYGEDDKASSFTDNGGAYDLNYNPVTQTTSKTNPAGGLFQFNYDSNGNITSKSGPLGKNLSMVWDSDINVTNTTNGRDVETAYSYDSLHNVTQVIQDAGEGGLKLTTDYAYDSVTGKVNQITDPLNNISTMDYDSSGNLLSHSRPIGQIVNTYYTNGLLETSTDADGVQTDFVYDNNGYLSKVTIHNSDPIIETIFTYDDRGNRTSITDPNGITTNFGYDSLDRLTSTTGALGNLVQFDYDNNSNLIQITDAKSTVTKFEYDAFNRLVTRSDGFGTSIEASTMYTYDLMGYVTSINDPLNHVTTYSYDVLSRVSEACDHLAQCFQFTYDEVGNLVSKTDPNGNSTNYTYDSLNRLQSVTDAEGFTTSYTYDGNSNLLKIIDANENTATTNAYDANNRLISSSDALGYTDTRTYSLSRKILTSIDAKGQETVYDYDTITGRLSSITYPDDRVQYFTYNLGGQLLTSSDTETGQTIVYTYDEIGRLSTETQLGHTLTYGYDANGNRTSLVAENIGTYTYQYDQLNRLTNLTNPDSQTSIFTYNKLGLRTSLTYGNGSLSTYTYDGVNRLTSIVHEQSDSTIISSFSYTYDNLNNRMSETNSTGTISYTYDKTYKLLSAEYPDGEIISFTYDGTGNRLTRTDSSGTVTYAYDDANRLTETSGPEGTTSYTWDDNGNILSSTLTKQDLSVEITFYAYDPLNQLIGLSLPEGTSNSYTYDTAGRRTSSSDGSTTIN